MYALHGFLGLPSDWDQLALHLHIPLQAIDVSALSHPSKGLFYWARAFNDWVAKQPVQRPLLLGYSQGGRLAMHALVDRPELWAGAIIISAHTGLQLPEEKRARLQSDRRWGQRFLYDPWERVVNDWNLQSIFQGHTPPFSRQEHNHAKDLLASALEGWSLAAQDDLQEALSKLRIPLLWMAGERDLKSVEIAQQMAVRHPYSSYWMAPLAGHRVPWERPDLVAGGINAWISSMDSWPKLWPKM
jgi:2-succinyl-6-hydroxy-2,4-cyclohexadiene-1-carboxylate synthase